MDWTESMLRNMTLEEKIAQLCCVEAQKLVDDTCRFCPKKAEELLANGIGQVVGIAYTLPVGPEEAAVLSKEIQDWIQQNTRGKIPAILHEESLSGLAAKCAPIFPHPIGLGSMWEPELVEEMADSIRVLMRSIGTQQALSPVLDISSDPRWGRNEETYGEDPYLVAANACAFIKGLQGEDLRQGIVSTAKHFAGHGQSEGGRNCAPVHMGMRELRDSALFPFEAAVKYAGVRSVMNAYHEIDGIPCAASKELLTGILREEWGFSGIVVSDYFSIERLISHHAIAGDKRTAAKYALEAGIDLEAPYPDCYAEPLLLAVQEGLVKESDIDRSVGRILELKRELGLFETTAPVGDAKVLFADPSYRELARKMAEKSMVLLKNEDEILPLKPDRLKTIAVIGPNADSQRNLLGSYSYASLNKHFGDGGHGDTFEECFGRKVVTVLEGLQDKLDGKMTLKYACGCDILSDSVEDFQEAVKVAAESDAAIIVVGDRSGMFMDGSTGESVDRVSNRLYGVQEALVHAVAETGTPIILVLINGRPPYISPILGKVKAVLEAWLPGEEGGDAIAGVLAGDVNPGGKLTVSLLKDPGQHPLPYNLKKVNFHKEYLDCSMRPEFPFGHGLSYTTFAYSDLEIHVEESSGYVEASFLLTNSGKREGDEVVQLYIQDVIASIARPVMELKGFKRISLKPAECKKVTFRLYIEQLAFHNREMKLVVEPGEFRLMIGSSSADIRLEGSFCLGGENREIGAERRFFSEVDFE